MVKISEYLRVSEAAEYLGVSRDTLRRWDRSGKLEARRHPANKFRLYLRSDLDKFLGRIANGTSDSRLARRRKTGKRKR